MSDPADHRPRGYACPHCHAKRGQPCTGSRRGSTVVETLRDAYHWERVELTYNDGSGEKRLQRFKAKEKRAPPAGGLDLKAMAAAWHKAGKPGDWRSWCKVRPIHKR